MLEVGSERPPTCLSFICIDLQTKFYCTLLLFIPLAKSPGKDLASYTCRCSAFDIADSSSKQGVRHIFYGPNKMPGGDFHENMTRVLVAFFRIKILWFAVCKQVITYELNCSGGGGRGGRD